MAKDKQELKDKEAALKADLAEEKKRVRKEMDRLSQLQKRQQADHDRLKKQQDEAAAASQREREELQTAFDNKWRAIELELQEQVKRVAGPGKQADVASLISEVIQGRCRDGRAPSPESDHDMTNSEPDDQGDDDSLYKLPPPIPPRPNERNGRGSIQASRKGSRRGSSPPNGRVPPPPPPPDSSSSESSDSDSDSAPRYAEQVPKEIRRYIRELRKRDKKNRVSKNKAPVVVGKAPKMKEPESFSGEKAEFMPWFKAVKEFMTV